MKVYEENNKCIEKSGLEKLEKSLKKVGAVHILLNAINDLKDAPIDWSNVSCANIVKYMDIPKDKSDSMKGNSKGSR